MDILEQARVEWFAAASGLVVGVTMMFVPYEFGAAMFQYIYPHIRLLGSLFLVGSAMMLVALMYPAWPAFVGVVGHAFVLGAVAVYWWAASVLPVSLTGFVLYLLLMVTLVVELAICREIVERHGGHIQATSHGPGQGTCFTVRLLRAAVADAA